MCNWRVAFVFNFAPHNWHSNGSWFWLSCVRFTCCLKILNRLNFLLQIWHSKFLRLSWMFFVWILRHLLFAKLFLQILHSTFTIFLEEGVESGLRIVSPDGCILFSILGHLLEWDSPKSIKFPELCQNVANFGKISPNLDTLIASLIDLQLP